MFLVWIKKIKKIFLKQKKSIKFALSFLKYKIIMLIIPVKDGESIDKVLKKYKRKYDKTGVMKTLRSKQQFIKPSVLDRQAKIRASHKQRVQTLEEN